MNGVIEQEISDFCKHEDSILCWCVAFAQNGNYFKRRLSSFYT